MPKRPIAADDLLRFIFVSDPQISPDGARILFTRKHVNEKNKYITNLCSVEIEGKVTQWTQGEGGAGSGRWSPDGTQIAFVSGGRDKPASQVYLIPVDGGEARKLTSLPEGSIGGIRWSPDGKWIALTFRELHPDWTEKAKKERAEKGLSTPPREIDTVWYRLDGDGYFLNDRHGVYLVDTKTGEHRKLYDKDFAGMYSFDWSPDSKELAIVHSASKQPFVDPANDQIWRVDLKGKARKIPGLPKGEKSTVRWSPDGKHIAYAGDVDENDPWGVRNTKLYVVAAEGDRVKCLTDKQDYDLAASTISDSKDAGYEAVLEWAPDSKSIYVQIGWHGEQHIGVVSLKGGVELLSEGRHAISMGNLSNDGSKIAATYTTAMKLAEVCVMTPELATGRLAPKVLTNFNGPLLDELKLSEPEDVWIDSTDGTKVHAWVMKPIGYKAPKRYPAVLEVHGGPHTQYGWAFFHEFQVLAAAGHVVVFSNPRGSKGYGEAHTAAIRGDWGNKDWDDIQAVTRWMQHQPYIHAGKIGIMGGSYGGYMTNWAIGHSDAYKAAITDRCVSNMVSMAGSSDFPFNKNGYFKGVAWGDLNQIKELWKQSPIAFFEKVKTPTLIIHSEGDLRCNIEQSEQVFTALQQQGIVSRFVRYPVDTSHGMSRGGPPDLRLHRLGEITKWLGKHLK
ncbi:MAG: S9 family peptidase [Fimbriimonadaceae bacterium]